MKPLRRCTLAVACALLATIAAVDPVHAEPGDYSWRETLRNLTAPRKADNPVSGVQASGVLPLIGNPSTYNDDFTPYLYSVWQTVRLAPETGAVCGDGSPYKFFVNRVPNTRNTIIYFEGGGACWDYESCSGKGGPGARNPNGIPDNYMSLLNPGASLASPFIVRLHPWTRVKTQRWNMVYVPYCTGDVHAGDRVALYSDPNGQGPPFVWHHSGARNVRAMLAWLKNNLERPTQALVTGCSAGGVGSIANFHHIRRDLAPDYGYLINDSGPVFFAQQGASPAQQPSVLLHARIRAAWQLDTRLFAEIQRDLPLFSAENLGSLYGALATRWPADRMGHVHFWDDTVFSRYSYATFFPEITNEPDAARREQLLLAKWQQETALLSQGLAQLTNFGGYFPRYRALAGSHCATIVDFFNGDIQEQNLQLGDFVGSVLDAQGPVLHASETDTVADRQKPSNTLYLQLSELLAA